MKHWPSLASCVLPSEMFAFAQDVEFRDWLEGVEVGGRERSGNIRPFFVGDPPS